MSLTIEEGIRRMIDEGEDSLKVYWLEDVQDGDESYWLDICEDRLDEICEFNWAWDIVSKKEIENDDDPESEYGSLESDIIVDEPFSEEFVKRSIEEWLGERDLDIDVDIISPEGTVAEQRILNAIESGRDMIGGFT